MSLSEETKAAVKAHRERHGCSHQIALAFVMAERAAAKWNARWPIGTLVVLEVYRGGPKVNGVTRSEAWALPSGHASVMLEGRSGGHCLDFLTPGAHLSEVIS